MPANPTTVNSASADAASQSSTGTTSTQGGSDRPYFDPEKHVEKSEFTKLRQRDAADREEFTRKLKEREETLTAREQQILQAAQMLQQYRQQQAGRTDPFAKIRDLPYVDGSTLAELVEQLKSQDIGGIVQAIRQRDQALKLMHGEISSLRKEMLGHKTRTVEQDFATRLAKVRDELGLPNEPWAAEYLEDVYRSHEGDDLDQEFPAMARTRLDSLRKAFRALDKAEAEKAKRLPIPGKGGDAAPTKKLDDGYKPPRQKADELFDMFLAGTPND